MKDILKISSSMITYYKHNKPELLQKPLPQIPRKKRQPNKLNNNNYSKK